MTLNILKLLNVFCGCFLMFLPSFGHLLTYILYKASYVLHISNGFGMSLRIEQFSFDLVTLSGSQSHSQGHRSSSRSPGHVIPYIKAGTVYNAMEHA